MANINWKIDRAIVVDNFRLENEDGSSTIMNDVIAEVVLCATVMVGEKEHRNNMLVTLNKPATDMFLPLSAVDKAKVLTWAMDAFGDIAKARVEERLNNIVSYPQPTKRVIFDK